MHRLSRRQLLAVGAASLALWLPWNRGQRSDATTPAGVGPPFDDAGIRALGRRALEEGVDAPPISRGPFDDADALRELIAGDLATGAVLSVGGWVLSRTEVAICIAAVRSGHDG